MLSALFVNWIVVLPEGMTHVPPVLSLYVSSTPG